MNSKIINFNEIKDDILKVIHNKNLDKKLHLPETVTLIDGFVNQPMSIELTDTFVIGNRKLPMILLLGSDSGQIYYFSLQAILPNL